ncbi:uncharacterized protein [Thunnus thynnus]|uniref:uncharacterized protein n=1 Tax=Thunnus thynnus TaxID=8237 RepID=UPI003529066C
MAQQGAQLDRAKFCCSICLDLLKDPVTIPCGHSYCMSCIKSFWEKEDEKKIYSCPQCRQTFTPRPVLMKNTMLADLVEELKKTELQAAPADHCYAGPEDVACDFCTGRKLKAFKSCLNCPASYCEKHLQPHFDAAPFKKHKLVDPSKKLQENICSRHDEVMKMFCRTDQQSICYLCSVEEHKGHDTVSAAAERTERQRELEVSRQNIQQSIQDREKDVKLLQQEVEAVSHSADKAVEDSEKIFTELIRLIQKRSSDVKQQIRSQQETEVSRVKELQEKLEQEITELKRKDAELKQLSHTEDHNQFLHNYPSLSQLSASTDSSSINIRPLRYFEDVTAAVSELRDQLQDILREKRTNISLTASSHFTPELSNESGAISYRFTCPGPGVFQCMLTKLVFTMDQEGELLYRTVQWDESRLQLAGKRPAGPLFDIKCSEDAVSKLHLPHCEIKPAPLCLSVVHISDDGMSFLEPLEITDTHVVVDVPHLSAFGLVWDIKRFFSPNPKPIRGQVLLFHRPAYKKQSPKLNVFLLPYNVPVPEVKGQQENAEYIEAPSSCDLIVGQTYNLHCSEAHKVLPKGARFEFNHEKNYHKTFEIRLTPNTDEVTVTVQDQERKDVWEYPVELLGKEGPDQRRENLQKTKILSGDEEERLRSVRTEFIKRVSDPVLNNLLDALLQDNIINDEENDWIKGQDSKAEKARNLIDTVLKKGNQACKTLIDTFCKEDKCLSAMLQLQQS